MEAYLSLTKYYIYYTECTQRFQQNTVCYSSQYEYNRIQCNRYLQSLIGHLSKIVQICLVEKGAR